MGAGNPPLHRFRVGLEFLVSGHRDLNGMIERHAKLAQTFAEQLGLPHAVIEALGSGYEQWNGRGWPRKLAGEDVPVASRLAHIAEYVEVAHRVGGNDAAIALARKQRGKQFDPALADLLCDRAAEIFSDLDSVRTWDAVIEAEPALTVVLSDEQFDASLLAIANFVDLKSPYTLGHSSAVAELGEAAGAVLGLPLSDVSTLRRAGLVLGFGRLGVSNSIWDKPGPLGAGEWERVRMHPYITERMLHRSIAARASRCNRGAASRAPRRLGLPARDDGRSDLDCRPASWAPRTRIRRCASRVPTAQLARPMTRRKSCAPRFGRAASTVTPWKRCSVQPVIACGGAGKGPPGSPRAKSRCCGSWSEDCPPSRSPSNW